MADFEKMGEKNMTRTTFEHELSILHTDVLKMGTALEKTIDYLLEGLTKRNTELLQQVVQRDDIIDQLEAEIEKECITLILQQQPVASDLRNVTSVLKMITDIERIADHCTDIAEYFMKILLHHEKYTFVIEPITEMAIQVKQMISKTIDAYVKLDDKMAIEIAKSDDKVDQYFHDITKQIQQKMKQDNAFVEEGIYFLYIIKYLERMADHTTNICEWIVYRVTGKRKQYN